MGIGILWSQDYYFNRLIQYQENETNTIQLLYNSQNFDFFLLLKDDASGVTADLYDQPNKRIHNFDVNKPMGHSGLAYGYTYASTERFVKSKTRNSLNYEFTKKESDNNYDQVNLKVFDEKNPDKSILTADLTMRNTHSSKFEEFNLCCLMGFDYLELIQPKENYVVIQAEIRDQSGKRFKYNLVSDQIVQFTLRVPEKPKR